LDPAGLEKTLCFSSPLTEQQMQERRFNPASLRPECRVRRINGLAKE